MPGRPATRLPPPGVVDLKLPGVAFYPRTGRWTARINIEGKRRHLGYFDTQEEAHAAYVEAQGARMPAPSPTPQPAPPTRYAKPPPGGDWIPDRETRALIFADEFREFFHLDVDLDPDDPGDAMDIDDRAVSVFRVLTVSREECVSPWVVSEAFMPDSYRLGPNGEPILTSAETLRARIRLLRDRALLDRVSEVIDRAKRTDAIPFEAAVAEIVSRDLC